MQYAFRTMLNNEKIIFLLAAVVLFITAIFSAGYYHLDEHFQILEFAALKLGHTTPDKLAWEYHQQMRPALQPAIAVLVCRALSVLGSSNPFVAATTLRLLSAALAFCSMLILYQVFSQKIENKRLRNLFLLLSCFLWFLVFNRVRFSAENWSGCMLVLSVALFVRKKNPRTIDFLLAGALAGLSFLFKNQVCFCIAGFFAWMFFVKKERLAPLMVFVMGFAALFAVGVLIDKWFYGEWVCTFWNYFEQNLVNDKASTFGVSPWWYYLQAIVDRAIPPFSLVILVAAPLYFFWRPKDVVTWVAVPFLLFHFFVPHKETRFLFPLLGFLPFVVVKGVELLQQKVRYNFLGTLGIRIFVAAFWIVNLGLLLLTMFKPADMQVTLFSKLYRQYPQPTTLYYASINPYETGTPLMFYKQDSMQLVDVKNFAKIDSACQKAQTCLFICTNPSEAQDLNAYPTLVYTHHIWWPRNGATWYVYELK